MPSKLDRMDRAMKVVWLAVLVLLAFITALDFGTGDWLSGVVLSSFLLSWLVWPATRRAWIGVGRWRGRQEMFASLNEAALRGLSFTDWITAEAERDHAYTVSLTRGKDAP